MTPLRQRLRVSKFMLKNEFGYWDLGTIQKA